MNKHTFVVRGCMSASRMHIWHATQPRNDIEWTMFECGAIKLISYSRTPIAACCGAQHSAPSEQAMRDSLVPTKYVTLSIAITRVACDMLHDPVVSFNNPRREAMHTPATTVSNYKHVKIVQSPGTETAIYLRMCPLPSLRDTRRVPASRTRLSII